MRKWLVLLLGFSSIYARDRWITVFTHGGGAHPMYLNLSDVFKVIHDRVERSVYTMTSLLLREDPYFYQVQPQQGFGFKKAFNNDVKFDPHNGAHLFSLMYDTINKKVKLQPTEFYSFGWSGLLSIRARRIAAGKLYHELETLTEQIRKEGDTPHIRIIAYSHGGNTALHLVEEFRARGRQRSFVIDELILVATPVQSNTLHYVSSPLFKKVFLFYSLGDNIQSSDFLSSPTHSFAHHAFTQTSEVKVPPHVTQIQIRIFRKQITVIQKDGTKRIIRRHDMIHPNHTEMFFFGWTPEWYRKHFPIKPLSVTLLLPVFMRIIRDNNLEGQDLRFTIIPDEERIIVDNKKTGKSFVAPFFDRKTFAELRNQLWQYKPTNIDQYKKRMKEHWEKAKKMIKLAARQRAAQRRQMRIARTASKKIITRKAKNNGNVSALSYSPT